MRPRLTAIRYYGVTETASSVTNASDRYHGGFAPTINYESSGGDREELVLRGPMRLQGHTDLGRVNELQRDVAQNCGQR